MSLRVQRVNELLRQEIAPLVGMIQNEELGMITITSVDTLRDLSKATVWVSFLDAETLSDNAAINILKKELSDIHNILSKRIHIKRVPRIRFKIDHSKQSMARLDELFAELGMDTDEEPDTQIKPEPILS
jgi:ribosome-binding factor A